ncbi:hypothetical protein M3Y94_01102700 [Aphelenchoides besseyi]|nr:hypothetical protein M3Y94_01102700 [Aphelenchoides besseyi]
MRFGLLIALGVLVCVIMPELGFAKRRASLLDRATAQLERSLENVKQGRLPLAKRDVHPPKEHVNRHRTQHVVDNEEQASGHGEDGPRYNKKSLHEDAPVDRQTVVTPGRAIRQSVPTTHSTGRKTTEETSFFEKAAKEVLNGFKGIFGGKEDEHHKEPSTAGYPRNHKETVMVDAGGSSRLPRPAYESGPRGHRAQHRFFPEDRARFV